MSETKQPWTSEEDALLRQAVGRKKAKDWKGIAKDVFGNNKTEGECQQRWEILSPIKLPWSQEEDALLIKQSTRYGFKDWHLIATHFPGRGASQCGERWFNHLAPALSQREWSSAEDSIVIKAFTELGNAWDLIALKLPGRSAAAIKIRWNATLRKTKAALPQGPRQTLADLPEQSWTALPVDCLVYVLHCLGRGFALWALIRVVCKSWLALSINEQCLGVLHGVVRSQAALKPVSRLVGLQVLQVSSHYADMRFLSPLVTLRSLELLKFKLNGEGVRILSRLIGLRRLVLQSCHGVYSFSSLIGLHERGMESIAQLTALRRLNLLGCHHLTDAGISYVSTLTKLEFLDFSSSRATANVLENLSSISVSLQDLRMPKCAEVTDGKSVDALSLFVNLRRFDARLQISNDGLLRLASLSFLQHLDLSGLAAITDAGLAITVSRLHFLQSLSLFGCPTIREIACLSSLTGLQSLNLGDCNLSLEPLMRLVSLTHLTLKMSRFADAELKSISPLIDLQVLDLSFCANITDGGVAALSTLTALRTLNLSSTRVTAETLGPLPSLEELKLNSCGVTEHGLMALASLPRLRDLEMTSWHFGSPTFKILGSRSTLKLRHGSYGHY